MIDQSLDARRVGFAPHSAIRVTVTSSGKRTANKEENLEILEMILMIFYSINHLMQIYLKSHILVGKFFSFFLFGNAVGNSEFQLDSIHYDFSC